MNSTDLFQKFCALYEPFLPPLLRDVLSEPDRQAFLQRRFAFISKQKQRHLELGPDPVLWNGDCLELAMPDLPFLVDTILNLLDSYGIKTRFRITALFAVQRDEAGKVLVIEKTGPREQFESWIYLSLEHVDTNLKTEFLRILEHNLTDLERMIDDFPAQLASLAELEGSPEFQSDRHWLLDNFILMGTAHLSTSIKLENGLGMLRDGDFIDRVQDWLQRFKPEIADGITIFETDLQSEVKRRKPLHVAIIRSVNGEQQLLIGSFAAKGELSPRFTIPALHRKLDHLAGLLDIPIGSHNWRELYRLTQLVPLGLLFSRSSEFWEDWLRFLVDRQNVDDAAHRFLLDEAYGGCWLIRTVFDGEEISTTLRNFFSLKAIGIRTELHRHNEGIEYEFLWLQSSHDGAWIKKQLEENEGTLLRSYRDRLLSLVTDRFAGATAIRERSELALGALNEDAQQHLSPSQLLDGLLQLERQKDAFRVTFEQNPEPAFHVFSIHAALLSEMTPAFDSCSLAIEHSLRIPFQMKDSLRYRHIFFVAEPLPLDEAQTLCEVLSGILNGRTGVEPINRLSRRADFSLLRLRMLKSLLACLYQMDRSVSRLFLMQIMLSHAELALAILKYTETTFSTDGKEDEKDKNAAKQKEQHLQQEAMEAQIALLRTVPERMAGTRLRDLVLALVRTDFLLDQDEICLKIESRRLVFVEEPRPLFEIFVYASDFEGVHLRFGPVSRGGIRWSDRVDDFRVEILGLVHTQRVKNTMIVPEGSKGGFVLKRIGVDPSAGKAAYKRFMRSLLRLTDNLINDQQVRPEGLLCLDGFDPYLVVAADRGTARFSDTANEVSAEQNFWIGDAFASGGSNGYDHKKQGITAKGAWESVKAHFAEMDMDPHTDVIRTVGIGDMSGDVFGNGMILSDRIKLMAAFNHRFIFLDPDPDPATSYKERQRMFQAGLDWDNYSANLLSTGGAVLERDRADLKLSREVQKAFGIRKETVSGDELIRAILCSDVDLFWNGGIGTYVKARSERNEEAGDPANDSVRVDGRDLRARVVGEGGNLGFSMQGRYEAAAVGVRLNTDAVDNSGGVDMSDHEVNLKILLQDLVGSGAIPSREERNQVIRDLEEGMIDQVLANNRSINDCIKLEERRLKKEGSALRLWMKELHEYDAYENDEIPPDPDDLSSPFLSNLVGWSKLSYRSRLSIAFADDRVYHPFVERRFTGIPVDEKVLREAVHRHPLRDAIARTEVINHIVHRAGPLFLFRIHNQLGLSYETIVLQRLRLEAWLQIEGQRKKIDAMSNRRESLDASMLLEQVLEQAFFVLPLQSRFDQQPAPSFLTREGADPTSLLMRLRLYLHRIAPDREEEALQRLDELHLDELEDAIRLIAVSDRTEMRFQGRLLLQLEQIRSVSLHENTDARRMRQLMKSMQEARKLVRERPGAAIALYEHIRDCLEGQQSFNEL